MRGHTTRTPFVGRRHELAVLTAQLTVAGTGQSRIVLITGDAGLGKSRLVATARPLAAERGFLIVEGTCFPQDRADPYAPLVDAVRARFAGEPPEAIVAACGPFVRDLQPLLPDLLPRR
jgi:predicted ATPase